MAARSTDTDSMTALERAARALLIAEGKAAGDGDVSPWADDVMANRGPHSGDCTMEAHTCLLCERERVLATAATVARALREHEAMLEAMDTAACDAPDDYSGRAQMQAAWQAAIDFILAEQPTEKRR